MPILATGSKFSLGGLSSSRLGKQGIDRAQAGFTLIELLVAIAVFAIMLSVAVLAIPNHDDRYWRDNLDQLVTSLNLAQEESAMSGMTMVAQVDTHGWRFIIPGGTNNAPLPRFSNANSFIADVYQAKNWYKPVDMAPLHLTLGAEQVTEVLQIPIRQVTGSEVRQAVLMRNRNGRFSWIKS